MLVTFERQYMPILGEFMAKDDARYYLNGFHVKPHPEGEGVILSATDGHRAVVIHDKEGHSDGEYILPISKALLSAAKKSLTKDKLPINQVHFIKNKVLLRFIDVEGGELPVIEPEQPESVVHHTEFFSPIDGRYPNISIIFSGLESKLVESIGVNVDYIGKLSVLLSKYKIAHLNFHGDTNSITVVAGHFSEITAIIMPARSSKPESTAPSYTKYAGNLESKTDEGAE